MWMIHFVDNVIRTKNTKGLFEYEDAGANVK